MAQLVPEDILRRIGRLSGINGWSITIAAGLGAVASLLIMRDVVAGMTGIVVAAGGITELRGRKRLLAGDAGGMRLLFMAQLIVLGMLWVYAVTQLLTFDAAALVAGLPPDIHAMIADTGIDQADVQRWFTLANRLLYGVLILASLVYQGGLALYYRHRAPLVAVVLAAPPRSS